MRLGFCLFLLSLAAPVASAAPLLFPPIPTIDPILDARVRINVAELYADQVLFGQVANEAQLFTPNGPIVLNEALFGPSGNPTIFQGFGEAAIYEAAIPSLYFDDLRGGVLGYLFRISDTLDGVFAIDSISLSITTGSQALEIFLGANACFGLSLPLCPPSGFVDVSRLPINGTGFDEPISSITLVAAIPAPAPVLLLLSGLVLMALWKRREILPLVVLAVMVGGAGPAWGITQEAAIQALASQVLKPSTSGTGISAHMLPTPLTHGTVKPSTADAPAINISRQFSGRPQWFALVDLHPCAFFHHDVRYVFIDDTNGAVTSIPATDWPSIDGSPLGDVTSQGQRPILIAPVLPRPYGPQSIAPGPLGEFGDAPDGVAAYAEPTVAGAFPTRFATPHGLFGPGGHATEVGQDMLGRFVSAERGAEDPADRDGAES